MSLCRAHSSTDVCQRVAVRQRIGVGNTPSGVSLHPREQGSPWDWYAKAMASTNQWTNLYLETAFPFCWPPWQTKVDQSFWSSGCCPHICAMLLWDTATPRLDLPLPRAVLAGSPPDRRRACGGNLRNVSRPESQDNVKLGWPEHKALFVHQKCLEVPEPLDRIDRGQERFLSWQEFQLDWVQRLKGTTTNREVPGGHQG